MEGRSTFKRLRSFLPNLSIALCDQNKALKAEEAAFHDDKHTSWHFGEGYVAGLEGADIIFKSPGVPLKVLGKGFPQALITSQTEMFIRFYRKQITGITGTKGKSTTSALLHHILHHAGRHTLLMGNIGVPPFDMIDHIRPDTLIVCEMSSHQLEHTHVSPQNAILLSIYPEHLDHYASYEDYQQAKMNITRWQLPGDNLVYNAANGIVDSLVSETPIKANKILLSKTHDVQDHGYFDDANLNISYQGTFHRIPIMTDQLRLPGAHNRVNIAAAATIAVTYGISSDVIAEAIHTFSGLPHRLELAGQTNGIRFYNDSISTIPESTIAAIDAFPETSALILGGYDRGVDYDHLMTYLGKSRVKNLIFTGKAGMRMYQVLKSGNDFASKHCFFEESFDHAFEKAASTLTEGSICMLSPAAASYDAFRDFKERGERFRHLVKEWIQRNS